MNDFEYQPFLIYDQFILDMYGLTELAYCISNDLKTLSVSSNDLVKHRTDVSTFPIIKAYSTDKCTLEDFLIELFSGRYNFYGEPCYVSSDIFSEEEFEVMLQKGMAIISENEEAAMKEYLQSEIISYCTNAALSPFPEGNSPSNWKANCPSDGQHHISISALSNQWGCGYCGREGDINDLKLWISEKSNLK